MIYASERALSPQNVIIKYADDTALLVAQHSLVDVAQEYNNVCSWSTQNKLSINIHKTKEIIFHRTAARNLSAIRGRFLLIFALDKLNVRHISSSARCKRCISYSYSVHPSVRPSVCLSVTRRYCVKTTVRSTVQFAPLDSKNVSSFVETKQELGTGFPTRHPPRFFAAPNCLKMGIKCLDLSSFGRLRQ